MHGSAILSNNLTERSPFVGVFFDSFSWSHCLEVVFHAFVRFLFSNGSPRLLLCFDAVLSKILMSIYTWIFKTIYLFLVGIDIGFTLSHRGTSVPPFSKYRKWYRRSVFQRIVLKLQIPVTWRHYFNQIFDHSFIILEESFRMNLWVSDSVIH